MGFFSNLFGAASEQNLDAIKFVASITGFDAGLPGLDRFSGAIIYDDAHKPDEATSDVMREAVIENYKKVFVCFI